MPAGVAVLAGGVSTAVSYATEATPDAVADHYRRLFEDQSLSFSPTSNSFGTTG
jgi:hypothetical protein